MNGFWVITQKLQFYPLCSIYRHGGHDGWSAGSSDITFKGNPLRMIQAKFGLNWPSGFRGEDFWKSLLMDDGCQVMAIPHMTLWVRWAKKKGRVTSFGSVYMIVWLSSINAIRAYHHLKLRGQFPPAVMCTW